MSEPLVSWRVWRLISNGLASIVADKYWTINQSIHSKVTAPKNAYHPNNLLGKIYCHGLGIHSWKTKQQAIEYINEIGYIEKALCFGEIYSWGKIIECEKGYLSEFAYPKKLYLENQELVQKFKNLYGCEVDISNECRAILKSIEYDYIICDEVSGTTAFDSSSNDYYKPGVYE